MFSEYLNTSLALLVRLSLAPLYTVGLFGSFVRAHSKALGTEKQTNKHQKSKEWEFGHRALDITPSVPAAGGSFSFPLIARYQFSLSGVAYRTSFFMRKLEGNSFKDKNKAWTSSCKT